MQNSLPSGSAITCQLPPSLPDTVVPTRDGTERGEVLNKFFRLGCPKIKVQPVLHSLWLRDALQVDDRHIRLRGNQIKVGPGPIQVADRISECFRPNGASNSGLKASIPISILTAINSPFVADRRQLHCRHVPRARHVHQSRRPDHIRLQELAVQARPP